MLLIVFLMGVAIPVSSQGALQIVPGSAIGLVKIGDLSAQVQSAMGNPERKGWTDTEPKYWSWFYDHKKFTALLLNDKVVRLFVQHNAYRTKEGVGVDSTTADIERAMGVPTQRKEGAVGPEFIYATGIRFVFQGDTAVGVEVCPPSRP